MTGTAPQIEWYIARDGQRHGPISDSEMRKFVEFGHLRPTDLVWCPQFTEWQPASQAFPSETKAVSDTKPATTSAATSAPKPAASPAPKPQPQPAAAHPVVQQPAPSPSIVPNPAAPRPQPQPQLGPAGATLGDDAAWAEAMRSVLQPQAAMQPSAPARIAQPAAPSPAYHPTYQQPAPSVSPSLDERAVEPPPPDEPPRRRRDWIGISAAALAVILILCGLAWITWQNRAVVAGASAISSAIKAKMSPAPAAEAFRESPFEAPGETRDQIDASLQRSAIWRVLKRDHAEWYGERVTDIEQRRQQKQDERAISRYIADTIITLRRRNAQTALQSSPEHLRRMARTFGENLRQLGSRDGTTCFAFITFGESNPLALDLGRAPAFAETLQHQMVAIFEAIANGRSTRQVHPNTRRADYDLLTKELAARGWSQNDLAVFSDPQKLSSTPPEKVCSMVQEWFATHLALTDQDLQTRLLAESLKPLVGG